MIQPSGYYITLKWKCKQCDFDYEDTPEWSQKIGKWMCSCGCVNKVKPVTRVGVKVYYGSGSKSKPKPKPKAPHNDKLKEAKKVLCDLGYSSKDASSMVDRVNEGWDWTANDGDAFIRYVLMEK